jgi:hypothetical protein
MGRSQSKILWLQVWGLAAVQGAIALAWVIYALYIQKLLTQVGLPATLAAGLLLLENCLAAIMEPLMGSFSDQTQRWMGNRFPFIAVGMISASALFIAIPLVAIWGNAAGPMIQGMLTATLVAWAIAMAMFRSPALSLLGQYALASQLPQATSILTLVGAVAGAMAPLASGWILGVGKLTDEFPI